MLNSDALLEDLDGRRPPWMRERSNALPREIGELRLNRGDQAELLKGLQGRSDLLESEGPNETLYADKSPAGFRPVKALDLVQRTIFRQLVTEALPGHETAATAFDHFEDFDRAPIATSDASFIAVTDVSHFYDYIPHDLLGRELLLQGVARMTVDKLMRLLRGVMGRGIGIPQTYPSSHVLADTYIAIASRRLLRQGYSVWRYNDDFRIGCQTFGDATRVLELLNIEVRNLGLALNDRKTLRFSRSRYEERLQARGDAWEGLVGEIGDLGAWATEGSPYEEDYEEEEDNDDEEVVTDADAEYIEQSRRVVEFFDTALSPDSFERVALNEVFVGLMARALEQLAAAEASVEVRLENWLRNVPSITPALFHAIRISGEEERLRTTQRLASAIQDGTLHLDAWQDTWLAWSHRSDLSDYPALAAYIQTLALSSPSSLTRAYSLSALLTSGPDPSNTADALAREFDRAGAASREILAYAVADYSGPEAERLRSGIAAEDALYAVLARGQERRRKPAAPSSTE